MTLTSWCAPSPLPPPPATVLLCLSSLFLNVLCGLLKVAKLFASNQNQCRPPVATSFHVALLYLSLSLSSSLFLALLSAAATATACRKLPVAVASYRILSGSSPCSFPPSLFDSLQCCVGCTHLARLPVWGNMMWQVLFVAAALGRILCGLCCVIVDFMRTRPGPIKSPHPSPSPPLLPSLSLSLSPSLEHAGYRCQREMRQLVPPSVPPLLMLLLLLLLLLAMTDAAESKTTRN